MTPDPIIHPQLEVAHGFFTRRGGVSKGIHEGLNCGYGSRDDGEAVRINRGRVAETLAVPEAALITVHQIHGADVVLAERPWLPGDAPRGDALVSTTPGIALGILTADCTPVLFADRRAGVIGAAHAGWRGALAGVLEATVQSMEDIGAKRHHIQAVVGPCIAQASYEVGAEFKASFTDRVPGHGKFFADGHRAGHHQFDLAGFAMARLGALGLGQCHDLALDTYADEVLFYSYRRARHRDENDYGRQISAIALSKD
jgi:YfiH family protein